MNKRLMLVTSAHPETYTVDLLDWRNNWRMKGVPVLTGPATGRTGNADLPVFTEKAPGLAVVDYIDGVSPVVMGFLHNRVSAMRFADGRHVWRHASDVYQTCGLDGEFELYHPSGAMIRMGEGEAHVDLTGMDHDKEWSLGRNTGKAVKLTLQVGQSKIVIADSGIVITTPSLDINEA